MKSKSGLNKRLHLEVSKMSADTHFCSLEKHWHPAGLEFIRIYRVLGLPPLAFQLYLYMLIRSSPVDSPRVKNAHLHGDTIQKGEFFENKISVADFFGKGELEEKAKIN